MGYLEMAMGSYPGITVPSWPKAVPTGARTLMAWDVGLTGQGGILHQLRCQQQVSAKLVLVVSPV